MIGIFCQPTMGAEVETIEADATLTRIDPSITSYGAANAGPVILYVPAGTTIDGAGGFNFSCFLMNRDQFGSGGAEPLILLNAGDIRGAGGDGGGGWGATNLSGGGGGGGAGTPAGSGGAGVSPGAAGNDGTATAGGTGGLGNSATAASTVGATPGDGKTAIYFGFLTPGYEPTTIYICNRGTIWGGGGGGGGGDLAGPPTENLSGVAGGTLGVDGTASAAGRFGAAGLAIDNSSGSTLIWLAGDSSPDVEGSIA